MNGVELVGGEATVRAEVDHDDRAGELPAGGELLDHRQVVGELAVLVGVDGEPGVVSAGAAPSITESPNADNGSGDPLAAVVGATAGAAVVAGVVTGATAVVGRGDGARTVVAGATLVDGAAAQPSSAWWGRRRCR